MRIRKRPGGSSSSSEHKRQLLPIAYSYRYGISTGWFRQVHEGQHNLLKHQQQQQQMNKVVDARLYSGRLAGQQEQGFKERQPEQGQKDGNGLHCRCEGLVWKECKTPQIGDEAIGDEPRTPPPCCGEKPALPRQKEVKYNDRETVQVEGEKKHKCSSCGQMTKMQKQGKEPVKGESLRGDSVKIEQQPPKDEHRGYPSRDTAESRERSSHDNCGPRQQRLFRVDHEAFEGLDSASFQQDMTQMDPLLRAMHTVVSEAGIEGLTAREVAQKISSRGLISEADIPRSVKMAKAMRDSPYLVEINRSSKFVLWSTFLKESSKHNGRGGASSSSMDTTRKRKRQRLVNPANAKNNSSIEDRKEGIGTISLKDDSNQVENQHMNSQRESHHQVLPYTAKEAVTCRAPPRKIFDLNLIPEDDMDDD